MNKKSTTMEKNPPKIFAYLMHRIVEDPYRESLVGDFEEVFHYRVKDEGRLSALTGYAFHILRLAVIKLFISTVWSFVMLKNYLKVAFRNLRKHAGYSIINITGLAVGMACCILFFLWVQDELSFDRFHSNGEHLYRIVTHRDGAWTPSSAFSLGRVLKQDFPEIEKNSRFMNRQVLVRYEDTAFYETVALVDEDFLEMFSFPLIHGDPSKALEATENVVVTESIARKYFKGEDPVGKLLTINNNQQQRITGVVADPPTNSTMQFAMLAPFRIVGERMDQSWWTGSDSYVLLQQGVALEDLKSKIAGTEMKYDKRVANAEKINSLQHIKRMHLYGLNETGPILYVYLFSVIAIIVLLIACINFINLSTARASNRAREVGLRKVVGAGRITIIRQFFGESLLLSCMAFLLSIIIVLLVLPHFGQLAGKQLTLNPTQNISILIGLLAIAAFTGILSGSYPAFLLSSFQPISVLRESAAKGARNPVLRRILVVFQFTAAIILIIGSVMIQRQLNYIRNTDLGFDRENIIRLQLNRDLRPNYEGFKNALLQSPNIISVTAANNSPTRITNINPFYWEGRGPDERETLNFATVDYDYFETFGMDFVEGRSFSREHATDGQNYIVNEALVNYAKLHPPLGKMLAIWDSEGQIIGVVKDFHARSLHTEIRPVAFLLTTDWPHNWVFLKVKDGEIPAALTHIESMWNEYNSGYPFDYQFLDDVFEAQYSGDARIGNIFKNFTVLAIFISCLGLFGLASFMAEQRTKEIGIRKVLGASIAKINLLLYKEFFVLLAIANLIAWPGAYYAVSRLMSGYAYRTNLAWWVFLTAGFAAVVISLVTVSYQAIRAARANPVDTLRYE